MASDAGDSLKGDFYSLVPERILVAAERAGLRADASCSALNSYENRVYDIGLESGAKVVIKFYRPGRWTREAILEEHAFLKELAQNEIPAVSPLPIDGDSNCTLGEDDGLFFCVFPHVRGRALMELNEEQIGWMGRLVGRMHSLGRAHSCLHRIEIGPQAYGKGSLKCLLESPYLKEQSQQNDLIRAYEDLNKHLLDPLIEKWNDIQPQMQRIHGDLHASNLLWDSQGPFFLDFDDFGMGPRVQDFWLLMPGPLDECGDFVESFARNYELFCEFPDREMPLIEDLRKLRMLRYAAWIAQRWEDPAFPRAFPHFGSREYFLELLKDLQA